MRVGVVVVVVLGVACKQGDAPREPPQQARTASDEVVAPAGPLALTPEKLDAFVAYQRRMVEVYGSLVRELERAGARDAGTDAALKTFRAKAEAEERARAQAKLTPSEIEQLERLVGEVMAARTLVQGLEDEAALAQMEKLRSSIPKEQLGGFDEALAQMKRQREDSVKLPEVRKRYGDANVDLVLTREKALMENWQAMLAQLAGKEKAR